MHACRRAGLIEWRLLDKQDERQIWMSSVGDGRLRSGNLAECSTDMDGCRPADTVGHPRNRTAQRPVELERPRPVSKAREASPIAGRQSVARDCDPSQVIAGNPVARDRSG